MLACSAAAARSLRLRGLLEAQGGLKGRLAALASCFSCTTGMLTAWADMNHASLLSAQHPDQDSNHQHACVHCLQSSVQ